MGALLASIWNRGLGKLGSNKTIKEKNSDNLHGTSERPGNF